jgi:hypothetical protein
MWYKYIVFLLDSDRLHHVIIQNSFNVEHPKRLNFCASNLRFEDGDWNYHDCRCSQAGQISVSVRSVSDRRFDIDIRGGLCGLVL